MLTRTFVLTAAAAVFICAAAFPQRVALADDGFAFTDITDGASGPVKMPGPGGIPVCVYTEMVNGRPIRIYTDCPPSPQ